MAGLSDSLELLILNLIFGAVAYTPPATLYVGLSTADPLDSGSGLAEPAGNGYARVAVANNATNWPAAAAGAKANGTVVTFAAATGAWGTITHFVIFDAATAGNIIISGALAAAQAIVAGNTPSFAIGDIDITID